MATRNQRKAKAKARLRELQSAVSEAWRLEIERQKAVAARHEALTEVNKWHRKGTRAMCHPGLDKVC